MKISRLFHWLYAFLLTLPLVSSLWLGLIWTFNENAQVPTITENVSKEVDFNQLVYNGKPIDLSSYVANNTTYGSIQFVDNSIRYYMTTYTGNYNNGFGQFSWVGSTTYKLYKGHQYLSRVTAYSNEECYLNVAGDAGYQGGTFRLHLLPNTYLTDSKIFVSLDDFTNSNRYFYPSIYSASLSEDFYCGILYNQLFDLTEMFGIGNEPTLAEFNNFFPDIFYDYTLSTHVVIDDYSTREVLDNPINYMWLPSFGGMGWTIQNVMNYLVGNLFGLVVSSGIGLAIVKLLTYWLCISLIWLVFDVIMYVPLLIHRYLDKGVLD